MTKEERKQMFGHMYVDWELDSYRKFFDHEWAERSYELAKGTVLEASVAELVVAWRAAANTHHMPWLMIHMLDAFGEGKAEAHRKEWGFDRAAFFRDLAKTSSEFQLCLSGSQRLCYGAIYYAYEYFLLRTYRIVSGDSDFRIIGAEEFSKRFASVFDDGLRFYCWTCPELAVAREVRHALVHNGCRMTKHLKGLPHHICVQGDEILIAPADTTALHSSLKDRITKLLPAALSKLK